MDTTLFDIEKYQGAISHLTHIESPNHEHKEAWGLVLLCTDYLLSAAVPSFDLITLREVLIELGNIKGLVLKKLVSKEELEPTTLKLLLEHGEEFKIWTRNLYFHCLNCLAMKELNNNALQEFKKWLCCSYCDSAFYIMREDLVDIFFFSEEIMDEYRQRLGIEFWE